MSSASLMRMRATVERADATRRDGYGQKSAAAKWQQVAADVPCYVWITSTEEFQDDKKSANVQRIRAIFRQDADVKRDDRITSLTDRRGRQLMTGFMTPDDIESIGDMKTLAFRLRFEAVADRHALGATKAHKECVMRRVIE